MGKVIGYLRVSTLDQDLEKNKSDILKLANDKKLGHVEWLEEKVSGPKDWRKRKLGGALKNLKAGDTILVSELSRLGRSTLQILEIMQICKEREISVHAVKGGNHRTFVRSAVAQSGAHQFVKPMGRQALDADAAEPHLNLA